MLDRVEAFWTLHPTYFPVYAHIRPSHVGPMLARLFGWCCPIIGPMLARPLSRCWTDGDPIVGPMLAWLLGRCWSDCWVDVGPIVGSMLEPFERPPHNFYSCFQHFCPTSVQFSFSHRVSIRGGRTVTDEKRKIGKLDVKCPFNFVVVYLQIASSIHKKICFHARVARIRLTFHSYVIVHLTPKLFFRWINSMYVEKLNS